MHLIEGTPGLTNCTFLESLGFSQVFLVDFFEIKLDLHNDKYNTYGFEEHTPIDDQESFATAYPLGPQFKAKSFKKFKVTTNIKKASLYFAKDSFKTLN